MIQSPVLIRNVIQANLHRHRLGDWTDDMATGVDVLSNAVVDAYNKGLMAVQDAAMLPSRVVQTTLAESAATFAAAGRTLAAAGYETAATGMGMMAARAAQSANLLAHGLNGAFKAFTGVEPATWAISGVLLVLAVGAGLVWLVLQPGGQLLLGTVGKMATMGSPASLVF